MFFNKNISVWEIPMFLTNIIISNSKVEALIKDPTGKVAMYEFFDTGYNGDKIESDGIYSTMFLANQNQ